MLAHRLIRYNHLAVIHSNQSLLSSKVLSWKNVLLAMSLALDAEEQIKLLQTTLFVAALQVEQGEVGAIEYQEKLIQLISEDYVVETTKTGKWTVSKTDIHQAKLDWDLQSEEYKRVERKLAQECSEAGLSYDMYAGWVESIAWEASGNTMPAVRMPCGLYIRIGSSW